MSDTATGPRTLVLGDSWARGLGNGARTVARIVPTELDAREVLDLAKISRIVTDVEADHLAAIDAFAPDFALACLGGADSLVFPAPWFQRLIDRFAPPDWQGVTGLMPPARRSRDRVKRFRQGADTAAKTVLKQIMINVFGAHRRSPIEDVERGARRILDVLAVHDTTVVLLGCSRITHLTFPKTQKNLRATNRMLARLAQEHPNVLYVDSEELVDRWSDYLEDRVHLARSGHRKVADGVLAAMAEAGGRWAALVERGVPGTVDAQVEPALAS